jgi:hypothetical protein
MIAGGIAGLAVLALSAAALVKYLSLAMAALQRLDRPEFSASAA